MMATVCGTLEHAATGDGMARQPEPLVEDLALASPRLKAFLFAYFSAIMCAAFVAAYDALDSLNRAGVEDKPFYLAISTSALLGMFGGCLHGLGSISMHAGKRKLYSCWLLFYLNRPLVGAALGFMVDAILRAGIGGIAVDQADPKHQWVRCAWALLAGMFSPMAQQKLRDVFDALFRPAKEGDEPGTYGKRNDVDNATS